MRTPRRSIVAAAKAGVAACMGLGLLGGAVLVNAGPAFADNPPQVNLVTPPAGPPSGGTVVQIVGTNFDPAGTNTVTFTPAGGGTSVSATNVSCSSTTLCTATSPAMSIPSGDNLIVDVQVTTDGVESSTLTAGTEYDAFEYYTYQPCTWSNTGSGTTQQLGTVGDSYYSTGIVTGSSTVNANCSFMSPSGWATVLAFADPLAAVTTAGNLTEADLTLSQGVGNTGSPKAKYTLPTAQSTFPVQPFTAGGSLFIAGLGGESVVGDNDPTMASCPPSQVEVNSGLVGCTIAGAGGTPPTATFGGGQMSWSQLTLLYSGMPTPQASSFTLPLVAGNPTVTAGVAASPTGGQNWWGSIDGAPYTKQPGDFVAADIPAPQVWIAPVGSPRSSAVNITDAAHAGAGGADNLTVSKPSYACTNNSDTTTAPNPCTFNPTSLGGSFTLPTLMTPGSYTVWIDEPNISPLPGNGPNDAYQLAQDPSCTTSHAITGDCFGTVEASETVDVLPFANPPSAPQNVQVSATGTDGEVHVQWTAPANDGGTPVTGYMITCTPECDPITTTGASATSANIEGLTDGTSYTINVAATNLATPEPPTYGCYQGQPPPTPCSGAAASAGPVIPYGAPLKPAYVNATATGASGQVVVDWAPANDNGRLLTGYTVTCASCTAQNLGASAITATFNGLANSATTFTVTASNIKGPGGTQTSNSVTPYITSTAPGAPTAVVGAPTGNPGEAIVTWTDPTVAGASAITGYTITPNPACPSGCTGLSAGAGATTTTVGGLPGGPYTFTVTATNGTAGPASLPTQSVALPPAPLTSVTGNATGYAGQVALNWGTTAPADNGSPLTGYTISIKDCSVAAGSTTSCTPPCATSCGGLTAGPSATGTTVTGLIDGDCYDFNVQAVNAIGSAEATATTAPICPAISFKPPDPPTDITVTATGVAGQLQFTWDYVPPNYDGGTYLTDFLIYNASCVYVSCPHIDVADGGVPETSTWSYTMNTLPDGSTAVDGTSYQFKISAVNAAPLTGALSAATTAVAPYGPAGPPTKVVAALATPPSQVNLSWVAPTNTNGAPITGYTVTPSPSCGGCTGLTTDASSPNLTSTTIVGLAAGTPYTFTVDANNGVDGTQSLASKPVTPSAVPDAPTNVSIAPGDTSVIVTFTVPPNNGQPIRHFVFTPTVNGVAGAPVTAPAGAKGTPLDQTKDATDTHTLTGFPDGSTVTVVVAAANIDGPGPNSAPSNAVVPAGTPGRPDAPTGTPSDGQATLQWTVPADNGSAISAFTVTASPRGGLALPPVVVAAGGGSQSPTPGAADSFVVTGLTDGTAYQFTVSATNAMGQGPASGYSNPITPITGYWLVGSNGAVYRYGQAPLYGSAVTVALNAPIVGMASPPGAGGYWLVGSDGGIYTYGHVHFYGSTGGARLNKPVVGIECTPDGGGYWMVASDGGIFAFGDARFYGSTGGMHLNKPIVGMTVTPDGGGYWLVASDGGIFAFGDARFYGSTGAMHLNKPIVGMAATPSGTGYWMVASDGGIFAFHAPFYGSGANPAPYSPVVGIAPSQTGTGYWMAQQLGGVLSYGGAEGYPTTGALVISAPIVGMSAVH